MDLCRQKDVSLFNMLSSFLSKEQVSLNFMATVTIHSDFGDQKNKICLSSQSYGFSSSKVWMSELHHKGGWALDNWCFWTVVLEKTLESPLDSKEFTPVNPKGNQPWIFIGRTDVEAKVSILWPLDVKRWLLGKDWWWEQSKAKRKVGIRGRDAQIASLTQWTWI